MFLTPRTLLFLKFIVMGRDSFIFYRSFYEAINELPDSDQIQVYKAISSYSLNFEISDLKGFAKTVFILIKPQLDANNKRFINGSQPKMKQQKSKTEAKRKQNGSKKEANNNDNVNVNNNENDNKNVKVNEIPTLHEFLDYCKSIPEINYSQIENSIKLKYQSWVEAGWKDGTGKPIKIWKTKILNTIPFLKTDGKNREFNPLDRGELKPGQAAKITWD